MLERTAIAARAGAYRLVEAEGEPEVDVASLALVRGALEEVDAFDARTQAEGRA